MAEHDTDYYSLPLYTAAQMQKTDAAAIRGLGIPGVVLMERAGMAVAEYLLEHYCGHHCFVVLAGKGNNGGDGFVVARHLADAGMAVQVFAVAAAREYGGDAAINLKILGKLGVKVTHAPSAAVLRRALSGDCVIIDAVFGTGFSGEPRGKAAEFIRLAATAAVRDLVPVVAVDIASGVNASTGEIADRCLPARATVTFHAPKLGHFIAPGSYLTGDLILADIGIPADAAVAANHFLTDSEAVAAMLPPKMEYDSKFSVGRVLVAGGSRGLTGAACMAAEAALRSGAGVVTAAVPASLNDIFEQRLLEVMTLPLADNGSGHLTAGSSAGLLEAAAGFDAVAVGPGVGRDPECLRTVADFVKKTAVPAVIDADGINAFAGKAGLLKRRLAPTVLTPHDGELARLMGNAPSAAAGGRLAAAREAARRTGAVVLLKGSATIITDGTVTLVNPTGNPGLATAGSGDVLTGIIAALLAKGLEPLDAAAAGALLHGTAADEAAEDVGIDNLIASDLLEYLPEAFAKIEGEDEIEREH
ncbi:MAG: NAD(P)H-hydrate dehydratase [Thermoleophilia bacterium]